MGNEVKVAPTYCKEHPETQLREDIVTDEDGKIAYFTHPCPVCREETVSKARRELVNRMVHVIEYEMNERR